MLKGALTRKAAGVNILLYGPPGTGKTEFCKVIAAHLNAQLFAVGETDDDGDEPSRTERQMQLRLGQRLLEGRKDALVLFDEMEDLLPDSDLGAMFGFNRRGGSKVHLHRLLETNPVPTLWTTNSIDQIDPALLRRVTFALELREPPEQVRARIWARLCRGTPRREIPVQGPVAHSGERLFCTQEAAGSIPARSTIFSASGVAAHLARVGWPRGEAPDCNSGHAGSIPALTYIRYRTFITEQWQSGRMHRFRKPACAPAHRRFESYLFRHTPNP